MKALIALLVLSSVPALASTAQDAVRDELTQNLSFRNGYTETIGLRDGDADHACSAFVSTEIADKIQVGIADGDFHASYELDSQSLIEINRGEKIMKIRDEARGLSIVLKYANGALKISWVEKDDIFGFIPRTLRTRCD
jgi:hypothetical protein